MICYSLALHKRMDVHLLSDITYISKQSQENLVPLSKGAVQWGKWNLSINEA